MEFITLGKHWIYFGSGLSFLYVLLEQVKKTPAVRSFTWLIFITGAIQLRYGLYLDGLASVNPYIFLFLHTSVVFAGPLLYYFITSRLEHSDLEQADGKNKKTGGRLYWHLLPGVIFAVGEVIFFLQPVEQIKLLLSFSLTHTRLDMLHLITLLASLHISAYSIWCVLKYHRISRLYEIYELRVIWLVLILTVVANSLIGPGFFLKNQFLFTVGCSCITAVVICLYVVNARYPGFFSAMVNEIRSGKYKNTPLDSETAERAGSRLEELINRQAIYRDSELRMVDLAAALGLSVHQTSRLLNEMHGMSFNEYINRHRVEEACRLLKNEKGKNILTIAFQVGFNSKSTFNAQFARVTGMTPGEYKKKH